MLTCPELLITCVLSVSNCSFKSADSRLTGQRGTIWSKLPHTKPWRIYHTVLKSEDTLPAPWDFSLMKAVSLLMTCPGPHRQTSVRARDQEAQNLAPSFVQTPPENALPGLSYVTKSHSGRPSVISSPSSEKPGWENEQQQS